MKEIIFFCFKYLKINKFLLILLFLSANIMCDSSVGEGGIGHFYVVKN